MNDLPHHSDVVIIGGGAAGPAVAPTSARPASR